MSYRSRACASVGPADIAVSAPINVAAVYVHAPFCSRRCLYCDFAVHVSPGGDLAAWGTALTGELKGIENEGLFALDATLETLYVGGGTPSLLGPAAMKTLGELIGPDRLRGSDLEWTAEANPESLTPELAASWRAAGTNRLSIGVQTFEEGALRWMGRLHGSEGAAQAVGNAKEAGFDNLSVDLIFGLPARLGRSWSDDLERVLRLDVPHVSLYGLTIEPATPLGRALEDGRETPVDEEQYRDEFLMAAEVLTHAGYEHYEVSNFARPGFASRHNAVYWDGRPYLGLGNGAHSFADPCRRWNVRDWPSYQAIASAGSVAEEERETVDAAERALERTWLGLRTRSGLAFDSLSDRQRQIVEGWSQQGWTVPGSERVRLNAEGWLILDQLAVELDGAA